MKPMNIINIIFLLTPLAMISGCGGGADTIDLPNTNAPEQTTYNGPAPQNEDVQNFKVNVWDNLFSSNRCGQCHGAGGQSPAFVRSDDVNLAYDEANTVVDRSSPADSRLVTKVGGGHNCWLPSDAACADTITAYITAWVGESENSSNTIELIAPTIREPGSSKSFPESPDLFEVSVYPLLREHCVACHSDDAVVAQKPFFASSDIATAYDAVKSKIDLDTPASSRLVVRLGAEFHNCWSSCNSDATAMQAAIENFSNAITPTAVDPDLVISKSLRLVDGIVASSEGRDESHVIALYEFKTGNGVTAFDTSGVEPAMHLTLNDDVEWVGGYGIRVNEGKAQATTASSKKLHDKIVSSGEYSIEAWIAPANVTQEGPARIISYSAGVEARNFTLGQTLYNYDFMNRASNTSANGEPALSTSDAAEVLQATLQHVVVTYHPSDGRKIYVNGVYTGDIDELQGASLNDWDDTFAFVIGNEVSSDRLWQGVIRLVAIHNRALSEEQVVQNFDVGVGEKFFLLFSVSHLIGVEESYVVFEVSQFDSYSYLFSEPFVVSLDSNARFSNIALEGIRIGMNGKVPLVGQAYGNVATIIDTASFSGGRQVLSSLGTIIPLDKGPDSDEFFLSFERLGDHQNIIVEASPPAPAIPADLPVRPDIGLRVFDEINQSMSNATEIPTTLDSVATTYDTIKQQLPTVEDIDTFLSAHQMAITQLAIEYCNALVENTTLRSQYFTGFNFSIGASSAFDQTGKDAVLNPLINRIMGENLASQPDIEGIGGVRSELESLIDRLSACTGTCPAGRTETIVKASCAALLGSAVILVQ